MKRLLLVVALLAAAAPSFAQAPRPKIVTANNASCELGTYPAATLLLPYFDVDVRAQSSTSTDTVFTIVNTSRLPQVVHVTIWTDLGYPAVWFNAFLTGYDAQTLSLFEILARGSFPRTSSEWVRGDASADNTANPHFRKELLCGLQGGRVPEALLLKVQKMLTTGEKEGASCPVGTSHPTARGYVTIDVVNGCTALSPADPDYYREYLLFDNVLTGDYERINANPVLGNYAGGNPLVHIRAVPEGGNAGSAPQSAVLPYTFYDRYTPADARKLDRRQPLPSTFAARFIEGGPSGFLTNFAIWREGVVTSGKGECEYAKNAALPVPRANIVRFDEHENPTVLAGCGDAPCADPALPLVSSVPTQRSPFLPPVSGSGDNGGWIWLSLDHGAGQGQKNPYSTARPSQNWITVQMYAEGRYAVDFDATATANGCTVAPAPAP